MEKIQLNEDDFKELEKRIKKGKSELERIITDNPTCSVIAAFIAGFVISKILSRRD